MLSPVTDIVTSWLDPPMGWEMAGDTRWPWSPSVVTPAMRPQSAGLRIIVRIESGRKGRTLMDIFAQWSSGATTFGWQSSTPANGRREVTVFTRRAGTPGAPALVCVHGFPTSSIDYFALVGELGAEFDIFLLDFPGYGCSDKPPAPYVYSLYDDARLLVHAISQVWNLTDYAMITHDRGSSVGMIALGMLAAEHPQLVPTDVIITNANIYLPLGNLTAFQTALLDNTTGRATAAATTPEMLAAGLGASTFMPRRTLADPEIAALAKCFDHHEGIRVLPDTIQYLHERAADETSWLTALSTSDINTTLVWGLHDNISPVRVANYVWQTFLKHKPGTNRYWIVPSADHYLQSDAPGQLAQIVRLTCEGADIALQTLGDQCDGAVLVDHTPGSTPTEVDPPAKRP